MGKPNRQKTFVAVLLSLTLACIACVSCSRAGEDILKTPELATTDAVAASESATQNIAAPAQGVVQWRGDRTGVYPETNLLKSWPADGPELLWRFDGLGNGFTSVSIADGKIFITGEADDRGTLFVLDMAGKLLGKVPYGAEFTRSFPGTRNTVIPEDGKLYVVTGMMELFCYDMQSLELLWKKDYAKDFGAENTKHGWHGSPLFVGEKMIIAPGGETDNVVALDKATGEIIWSSTGAGVMSGYGNPIYIDNQPTPLIVVMMSDYITGLDAADGTLLWKHYHTNRFREHPNTPVYSDGMLLCTSAYGKGSVMLRLNDGGKSVEKVWEGTELGHQTGHVMKIGDLVYGAGEKMFWHCVDWRTGKVLYSDRTLARGNVIAADGMLYLYTDKGEMALVKPNPKKLEIVSQFTIEPGTGQHFAHPVLHNGIMYVRHGDALMAYKIKP